MSALDAHKEKRGSFTFDKDGSEEQTADEISERNYMPIMSEIGLNGGGCGVGLTNDPVVWQRPPWNGAFNDCHWKNLHTVRVGHVHFY